jgi:hypothetical protein
MIQMDSWFCIDIVESLGDWRGQTPASGAYNCKELTRVKQRTEGPPDAK